MRVRSFIFNNLQTITYVVSDEISGEGLIIDCACSTNEERDKIKQYIESENITPVVAFNTHLHFDHVLGNEWLYKEYGIKPYAHKKEEHLIDWNKAYSIIFPLDLEQKQKLSFDSYTWFLDKKQVTIGSYVFDILHTPGHTPGSCSLYCEEKGILFDGDLLFNGTMGRTDLEGGDLETILESLKTICKLPERTRIFPGHGNPTTIGEEIVKQDINCIKTVHSDGGLVIAYYNKVINHSGMADNYISTDKNFILSIPLYDSHSLMLGIKEAIKHRKMIIDKIGSEMFSRLFCWPIDTFVAEGKNGILKNRCADLYFNEKYSIGGKEKNLKWFVSSKIYDRFLPQEEHYSIKDALVVCQNIATAIYLIHNQGLAIRCLDYNHLLIDPKSGIIQVLVGENIVVNNIYVPEMMETPDFSSPEVVSNRLHYFEDPDTMIEKFQSSTLHSLAVIIYMLLFHRHPLRGSKVFDDDPAKDELLSMGEQALFIENPNDSSNRPNLSYYDEQEQQYYDVEKSPYSMYGPYLKRLFERAFINGLHNPEYRPAPKEWIEAIKETLDTFF